MKKKLKQLLVLRKNNHQQRKVHQKLKPRNIHKLILIKYVKKSKRNINFQLIVQFLFIQQQLKEINLIVVLFHFIIYLTMQTKIQSKKNVLNYIYFLKLFLKCLCEIILIIFIDHYTVVWK
jgi:hypothetical protein